MYQIFSSNTCFQHFASLHGGRLRQVDSYERLLIYWCFQVLQHTQLLRYTYTNESSVSAVPTDWQAAGMNLYKLHIMGIHTFKVRKNKAQFPTLPCKYIALAITLNLV